MIVFILLATIENSFGFSESLGFMMLEWCLTGFLILPFYRKKWHGLKGYLKTLKGNLWVLMGNF